MLNLLHFFSSQNFDQFIDLVKHFIRKEHGAPFEGRESDILQDSKDERFFNGNHDGDGKQQQSTRIKLYRQGE